jgi:hypothetical protein
VTVAVRRGAAVRAKRPEDRERVIAALTSSECRRLVRHPVFLAGVALSVLSFVTQPEVTGATAGKHFLSVSVGQAYFNLAGWGVLPLAFATLLALNLAALRNRRDRTLDLYASLPSGSRVRTSALLLASTCAFAIALVLVVAAFRYLGAADGLVVAYDGRAMTPSVYELFQGPIVVLLFGVLGVALAAWLPRTGVAVLVAFVGLATEVVFVLWTGLQSSLHWLFPLANPATFGRAGVTFPPANRADSGLTGFDVSGAGWHLAYLAALGILFASLALLRHGSRRLLVGAGGLALAVAVAASLPQLVVT